MGDTAAGKSSMITQYLQNSFEESYEPTVLDVYKGSKKVNDRLIQLKIYDTSGDEHMATQRSETYRHADIVMLCVPTDDKYSLDRVPAWLNEIRSYA